jgi:aromatic ring hydroxylase
MPLAVEHASVKYQLDNLDKTDAGLRQNKAAVEEHMRATGVTQKQQDLTKARDMASKMGSRYLNQFQETLRNNPDADAISVVAQLYDAQEEQKSISELRRHEIPDEEINKFRIPEVNANGQPTDGWCLIRKQLIPI